MTALTEQNEPHDAELSSWKASTTTASMTTAHEITLTERLESVKAGLLGALTAGFMFGVLLMVDRWLSLWVAPLTMVSMSISTNSLIVLINGAIVALSGFLFGVTYRYIIRQDQNPHLRSGAVLAFGLVRGLALAEGRLRESPALLPLVVLGVESMVLFASARLVLDWALMKGWLKPFGS